MNGNVDHEEVKRCDISIMFVFFCWPIAKDAWPKDKGAARYMSSRIPLVASPRLCFSLHLLHLSMLIFLHILFVAAGCIFLGAMLIHVVSSLIRNEPHPPVRRGLLSAVLFPAGLFADIIFLLILKTLSVCLDIVFLPVEPVEVHQALDRQKVSVPVYLSPSLLQADSLPGHEIQIRRQQKTNPTLVTRMPHFTTAPTTNTVPPIGTATSSMTPGATQTGDRARGILTKECKTAMAGRIPIARGNDKAGRITITRVDFWTTKQTLNPISPPSLFQKLMPTKFMGSQGTSTAMLPAASRTSGNFLVALSQLFPLKFHNTFCLQLDNVRARFRNLHICAGIQTRTCLAEEGY